MKHLRRLAPKNRRVQLLCLIKQYLNLGIFLISAGCVGACRHENGPAKPSGQLSLS
ncbi:hypothetical protein DPMN_016767 [Dreissena polymorpha]|uniref:Uncharacterized protein n=1 Tax=Dreissena polymorpha TaxID=45954 RepID=A0A9D4NF79_DREPO|nr:hypothetical protein DPMN_016767 [Dreissena polymorpha]